MTSDDADDMHVHEDTQTLVGNGEVTYRVEHDRERRLQSVVSKIDTAIEMAKAHAFNHEPGQRYGPKRANTEYKLRSIQAAVDEANAKPTFENVDGELAYVVEDGYYPEDYQHMIDVTDVAKPDRADALLHAQSALCARGYVVNSLRSDDDGHLTRLHVVALTWVYNARAYGKRKAKAEIDA